jgi:predicted ATPase
VVQAALLCQNEIMAVENPEVHLHPSLQLDITDYLIREAKTGKIIMIETHSDLVVRRVLRAILEEEIGQARVAIYFASLQPGKYSFLPYNTSLERLQVNDRGQVDNWPKGFMDDDIREARRLMDATYGSPPENSGLEEEDE